ncbi:MAG: hypothetical protein H7Z43_09550 [Clostridia bacterium]|nr:hypothetical protein [Deltaproteobacteria bacterium]
MLQRELGVLGPLTAAELGKRLGISQPTVSRLVNRAAGEVLAIGRARQSRYALRRGITDVHAPIAMYAITEDGTARRTASLHPILPRGFYVEAFFERQPLP